MKGANTEEFDEFGRSVALTRDGSLMAVGAKFEDSAASGRERQPGRQRAARFRRRLRVRDRPIGRKLFDRVFHATDRGVAESRRGVLTFLLRASAEKKVWIVDDYRHAIFLFSNDGKRLLKTIGEPNVPGADDKHFYRPTFMAFLPDAIFVADGYANTRVVKLDKDGNYVTAWGQRGEAGKETRPGYFNNVHGVAVDPQTRRVFVNDRGNRRIQVFDDNGKFLDQWSVGAPPSDIHLIVMDGTRHLWAFDRASSKMIKYDLNGQYMYSWGVWGNFPGGFWGVHGIHVDSEGNFYVAEVDNGGGQKFRPRQGANPAFLVAKGVPTTATR